MEKESEAGLKATHLEPELTPDSDLVSSIYLSKVPR